MAHPINYQLSIFGTYSVPPTPENITSLMTAINGETAEMFLPNLITGQQVEIPSNRITTISNLGYITQNQKYSVSVLNDRIDVIYNRIDDTDLTIDQFYALAVKVLRAIIDACHLKARRLAVNIQVLDDTLSEQQIANLGKKVTLSAEYYSQKPLIEWTTRINSESVIRINSLEECLNTILNITTAKATFDQPTALIYHLDINTLPQLSDLRFDATSLDEFVCEVMPIATEIIRDVERLISFER